MGAEESGIRAIVLEHRGAAVACALAVLFHLVLASQLRVPDQADGLVYFHAAQRLVDGHGLTMPYVKEYLSGASEIPPPAFGYWLPLATFFIAASFLVLGQTVLAALLPNALLVGATTGLTYAMAHSMTGGRKGLSILAALVVPLHPAVLRYATTSQPVIHVAFFGALGLWILARILVREPARGDVARLLVAGASMGLAALSRGDGNLLPVGGALAILLATTGSRLPRILGLALGFLLAMAPWYLRTYAVFGTPFPPASGQVPFVTTYEDIYSCNKVLSLGTHLAFVGSDPSSVLAHKLATLWELTTRLFDRFLPLIPFFIVGAFQLRRTKRSALVTTLFPFLLLLFLFYGLLATEVAIWSVRKTSQVALPFLIAGGTVALANSMHRRTATGLVLVFLAFLAASSLDSIRDAIERRVEFPWIAAAIEGEDDVVIMSRKPHMIFHALGLPAVQIPNENRQTILEVARSFDVTHLHLRSEEEREALRHLYGDDPADPDFALVASQDDQRLFRLRPRASD